MLSPSKCQLLNLEGFRVEWLRISCCGRYLAIIALLEALIKNSIIYWAPLIIASMVGHEMSRPPSRALSQVTSFRNITVTVTSVTTVAAPAVAVAVSEAAADHSGSIVALLTALPFGSAAVFMLVMAKHSAATGAQPYGQ